MGLDDDLYIEIQHRLHKEGNVQVSYLVQHLLDPVLKYILLCKYD